MRNRLSIYEIHFPTPCIKWQHLICWIIYGWKIRTWSAQTSYVVSNYLGKYNTIYFTQCKISLWWLCAYMNENTLENTSGLLHCPHINVPLSSCWIPSWTLVFRSCSRVSSWGVFSVSSCCPVCSYVSLASLCCSSSSSSLCLHAVQYSMVS